MPKLLNFWYEQLSYHKILPLEYNLSMKISCHRSPLADFVPPLREERLVAAGSDLSQLS
jgi:hypothetical protein